MATQELLENGEPLIALVTLETGGSNTGLSGEVPRPILEPSISTDRTPMAPRAVKVTHHSILLIWHEKVKADSSESLNFNPETVLEIDNPEIGIIDPNTLDEVVEIHSNEAIEQVSPSSSLIENDSNRPFFHVQCQKQTDQWFTVYSGYGTSLLLENLDSEKEYRYRLKMKDAVHGESAWSNTANIITSREKIYSDRLHKCIARNDLDNVAKILETGEVKLDALNEHGLTPLMHAAQRGNRRLVRMFLLKGCLVNLKNEIGRTSLMQAAFAGHLDCVRLLVDKGADWNEQDKTGQTALHLAVDNGHVDVVEFATRTGANVNLALFNSGWTPLFRIAVVSGVPEMVELLVRAGADVNFRDSDGKTALMTAVVNNHCAVVKALVEQGADLSFKNNFGRTAYQMAIALDRKDIIKFLEKQGSESKMHVAL